MSQSWKKQGGIRNLDSFNHLKVNSFATEHFTLNSQYQGKWDISGDLVVQRNSFLEGDTFAPTIYISNKIDASNINVSEKLGLMKQTVCGNDHGIGINYDTPSYNIDLVSNHSKLFRAKSSLSNSAESVVAENNANDLIKLSVDNSHANLLFHVDSSSGNITFENNHFVINNDMSLNKVHIDTLDVNTFVQDTVNAQQVHTVDLSATTIHNNELFFNDISASITHLTTTSAEVLHYLDSNNAVVMNQLYIRGNVFIDGSLNVLDDYVPDLPPLPSFLDVSGVNYSTFTVSAEDPGSGFYIGKDHDAFMKVGDLSYNLSFKAPGSESELNIDFSNITFPSSDIESQLACLLRDDSSKYYVVRSGNMSNPIQVFNSIQDISNITMQGKLKIVDYSETSNTEITNNFIKANTGFFQDLSGIGIISISNEMVFAEDAKIDSNVTITGRATITQTGADISDLSINVMDCSTANINILNVTDVSSQNIINVNTTVKNNLKIETDTSYAILDCSSISFGVSGESVSQNILFFEETTHFPKTLTSVSCEVDFIDVSLIDVHDLSVNNKIITNRIFSPDGEFTDLSATDILCTKMTVGTLTVSGETNLVYNNGSSGGNSGVYKGDFNFSKDTNNLGQFGIWNGSNYTLFSREKMIQSLGGQTETTTVFTNAAASSFKVLNPDASNAGIEIKLFTPAAYTDDDATGILTIPTIVVGTNDAMVIEKAAQTLTNKTLTAPTINGGTISDAALSGGTISDAALSGGTITGATITGATITGATGPFSYDDLANSFSVVSNSFSVVSDENITLDATDTSTSSNFVINKDATMSLTATNGNNVREIKINSDDITLDATNGTTSSKLEINTNNITLTTNKVTLVSSSATITNNSLVKLDNGENTITDGSFVQFTDTGIKGVSQWDMLINLGIAERIQSTVDGNTSKLIGNINVIQKDDNSRIVIAFNNGGDTVSDINYNNSLIIILPSVDVPLSTGVVIDIRNPDQNEFIIQMPEYSGVANNGYKIKGDIPSAIAMKGEELIISNIDDSGSGTFTSIAPTVKRLKFVLINVGLNNSDPPVPDSYTWSLFLDDVLWNGTAGLNTQPTS